MTKESEETKYYNAKRGVCLHCNGRTFKVFFDDKDKQLLVCGSCKIVCGRVISFETVQ